VAPPGASPPPPQPLPARVPGGRRAASGRLPLRVRTATRPAGSGGARHRPDLPDFQASHGPPPRDPESRDARRPPASSSAEKKKEKNRGTRRRGRAATQLLYQRRTQSENTRRLLSPCAPQGPTAARQARSTVAPRARAPRDWWGAQRGRRRKCNLFPLFLFSCPRAPPPMTRPASALTPAPQSRRLAARPTWPPAAACTAAARPAGGRATETTRRRARTAPRRGGRAPT